MPDREGKRGKSLIIKKKQLYVALIRFDYSSLEYGSAADF